MEPQLAIREPTGYVYLLRTIHIFYPFASCFQYVDLFMSDTSSISSSDYRYSDRRARRYAYAEAVVLSHLYINAIF
eukprot:COSAG06_NODE_7119_length_2625_cov_1.685669_1_plen_75_part_10